MLLKERKTLGTLGVECADLDLTTKHMIVLMQVVLKSKNVRINNRERRSCGIVTHFIKDHSRR